MTIRFDCQFCGKTLKADDAKAGLKVKCPSCEGMLTIPELSITEVVEEPADISRDEPERAVSASSGRKVPCPFCDEMIPPRATVCPSCGEEINEPKRRRRKYPFAGPVLRLYAAAIDFFAAMVFMGPGLLLAIIGIATADGQPEPPLYYLLGLLGIAVGGLVYAVIQVYMLMRSSQSIGKYFIKLKIMDYENDTPAGLIKTFLLRTFVNNLMASLTCCFYYIVDSLFVFGDEHRCLHDLIAGTYVADMSDA